MLRSASTSDWEPRPTLTGGRWPPTCCRPRRGSSLTPRRPSSTARPGSIQPTQPQQQDGPPGPSPARNERNPHGRPGQKLQRHTHISQISAAIRPLDRSSTTAQIGYARAALAERHGRRGSQATWSPALSLPAAVAAGYGPCAESPASDLLWRLGAGDCLMGVQLGFMGVQLGGKVIWAGFAGAAAAVRELPGQQREAVTMPAR